MADNIDVKDASSSTKTLRAKDLGSQLLPFHALMDSSGAEIIGEKAKASAVPVALPTDQALLGRGIVNPSSSFTRPANTTAYSSGQLVANSTSAGSVTALSFASAARYTAGAFRILRARLVKSTTSLTNASFRLHFYSAAPTGIANGDGGNWLTDIAGYLPSIDITVDKAFTDGAFGASDPTHDVFVKLASGNSIYGLLEARGAYTPGNAEVFTVTLEIEQT